MHPFILQDPRLRRLPGKKLCIPASRFAYNRPGFGSQARTATTSPVVFRYLTSSPSYIDSKRLDNKHDSPTFAALLLSADVLVTSGL